MRTLRYVSISVLLAGCSAILIASARQRDVIYPAKSVRIVQIQTVTRDGKSHIKGVRQRLITAPGEWKETNSQFRPDGSAVPIVSYSNKSGQYGVTPKTEGLAVVGEPSPSRSQFRSTKFLREHKEFTGEGTLLGYKTFIWRVETGPGGYIEQHFAPEVAETPIKIVRHQPDFETVVEPVSIEFIDVTPDMIATPDLPINTTYLNQMADRLERNGQKDEASKVRAFAASKEQSKPR